MRRWPRKRWGDYDAYVSRRRWLTCLKGDFARHFENLGWVYRTKGDVLKRWGDCTEKRRNEGWSLHYGCWRIIMTKTIVSTGMDRLLPLPCDTKSTNTLFSQRFQVLSRTILCVELLHSERGVHEAFAALLACEDDYQWSLESSHLQWLLRRLPAHEKWFKHLCTLTSC